jgi:hypothetical protein
MIPLDPDREQDRLIDRLVDGELGGAERRALLLRLDSEVGGQGWRRCALAFLEAQAWREAMPSASSAIPLGAAPAPQAEATRLSMAATNAPTRSARSRGNLARFTVAASLVGAFVLGWAVRGPGEPAATAVTAVSPAPSGAPSPKPSLATADPPAASDGTLAQASEPNGDGDGSGDGSSWNLSPLDIWERQGFAVNQRERMASVGLDDGRQVTMPVSEVRLRYVGNRMY